jgi:hypothetical protein
MSSEQLAPQLTALGGASLNRSQKPPAAEHVEANLSETRNLGDSRLPTFTSDNRAVQRHRAFAYPEILRRRDRSARRRRVSSPSPSQEQVGSHTGERPLSKPECVTGEAACPIPAGDSTGWTFVHRDARHRKIGHGPPECSIYCRHTPATFIVWAWLQRP